MWENAGIGEIEELRKTPVMKCTAEMDRQNREIKENAETGIFLPYIGGKIPPINRGFPPR